jgi:DNA-binding Lrp family transcriptional regulator
MLEVDDPSSKDSVISRIKLVDEVVMIMDFYERPVRVVFYHENDRDRERRLSLIQSICGDKSPITWQDVFAPCDMKLKRTDWQILQVLRRDSMQSNADIANELRVSARTVKRRLSFMSESKAIYSFARGDVKKMPGMVYFFLVDCGNGKRKDQVDEKITSRLENAVYVETGNKQHSTFAVVFHNPSDADETYRWMKSLDGADDVKMSMMREIISVPDWLDKEIDKHLQERS